MAHNKTERIGKTSGKLTVIAYHHVDGAARHYYECLCTCGNTCVVKVDNLDLRHTGKSRFTKSCGCIKKARGEAIGQISIAAHKALKDSKE